MLKQYKNIIQFLPVFEHGFSSKKGTWKEKIRNNTSLNWLNSDIEAIFKEGDIITVTRGELKIGNKIFNNAFFLKTVFWGYSSGMRGNNFENLFQENQIKSMIKIFDNTTAIENFEVFFKETKFKGLGISTLTKFLYFSDILIGGKKPLILDEQIMSALSKSPFKHKDFLKLERNNAHIFYQKYLNQMDNWASELETQPENIEMFLFMFHSILHPNRK